MARKKKTKHPLILRTAIVFAVIFVLVTVISFFLPKRTVPCANSISCMESETLKVENNAVGIFSQKSIEPPKINLSLNDTKPGVLSSFIEPGEKSIYVDLTTQKLYAYQGKTLFMQTYISSGKWTPTPTGIFKIWIKLRATRMTGGSGADYYDLPNVPYVMFFSNDAVSEDRGFSLHGAYWHNNFGHPMSHGCVNMRITDAQKLYDWVNPATNGYTTYADDKNQGTSITIYGEAP